jgi:hypothetical protein
MLANQRNYRDMGMAGGAIPDPVMALSKIISSLVDENGKILIPGIYDDVKEMTPNEEQSLKSLNYSNEEYQKQAVRATTT